MATRLSTSFASGTLSNPRVARRPAPCSNYKYDVITSPILDDGAMGHQRPKTLQSTKRCRSVTCSAGGAEASSSPDDEKSIWTEFVAETLLPTNQGKFRLRGYRHTVRGHPSFCERDWDLKH